MRQTGAARTTHRTLRPAVIGLIIVIAAVIGTLVSRPASSAAPSFREEDSPGAPPVARQSAMPSAPSPTEIPRRDHVGAISEADGALPDGVTVFDDAYPGIANLDPDLLHALRDAGREAADEGIQLSVNSGWRSPTYQSQLLRAAISEYGSEEEAARWVATAETSPHVAGTAVDIGAVDAATWLAEHGADYGLCQIYANEPWHYELRAQAIEGGCPRMYADPTRDPRMQP
jgi:LAS superfamily LD-carboxypeptidase LdcB